MVVSGFKCFNKGLINCYGKKFEVGKIYFTEGAIKFGNDGNGFHLCKRLEDTLRYFDAMNEEVSICRVNGTGKMVKYFDEYNEYFDMYAVEQLQIISELSREEIIDIALKLNCLRVKRFLSGYKLTDEEIFLFKQKFAEEQSVQKVIEYYQENKLDAFY